MFPVWKIGPFELPMFSLMVFLGVMTFTFLSIYLVEKREKTDAKTVNRLLIAAAIGFAALFVFAFLFDGIFHSIEEGKLSFGGITWLGGVVGGFPVFLLMIHLLCPKCRGRATYYFGLFIPGLALAHGIGRIGCFLGGCCHGEPTDSFLGIVFPFDSPAWESYPNADGSASLPVLPTQLFEVVFELVLFVVLMATYKKSKKHFLPIYLLSYATFRFVIEFIRGDDRGATGIFLSPSQLLSLLIIQVAVFLLLFERGVTFPPLKRKIARWQKAADAFSYPSPESAQPTLAAQSANDLQPTTPAAQPTTPAAQPTTPVAADPTPPPTDDANAPREDTNEENI